MHILPENLRSDDHRNSITPVLQCSVFEQTVLFYESPETILGVVCEL